MSPRRRSLAVVLLLALALTSGAGARKAKPAPCPDGRFVLDAAAGTVDAIVLGAGAVTLDGVCDATPATVRPRRKGTKVKARWASCGDGGAMRLNASIAAPACDRMSGTLKAKGAKGVRFTAARAGGETTTTTTTTTTTIPSGPQRTGLEALYALRDEVLAATVRGQHYIDLFDAHNTEILAWLMHGEGLYDFGAPAFLAWMPAFEALVNGRGATVVITEQQIADVEEFFARLSTFASPGLAQVIADEIAFVQPETLVGLTMDEAREVVLGSPNGMTARSVVRPRGKLGCVAYCLLLGSNCSY
jgi:hypothetical protein